MPLTFDLPAPLEQQLRQEWPDFDHLAKEAALVELYRQEKLTSHQLATALGLERLEVDELLKRHNVTEDLPTTETVTEQLANLRKSVAS